jgi:hypothetical protein
VFQIIPVSGLCCDDRPSGDSLQDLQDGETLPGETLAAYGSQHLVKESNMMSGKQKTFINLFQIFKFIFRLQR